MTTTENKPGPFPVNVSGLSFEVEESSPLRNDARSGADTLLLSQPDATNGTSSVARAGRLDSASDVDWYRVSAQGPFGIYERIWVSLDTASDSRWFDRHEVVIQTPNGYILQQARSGADLILELRASDTVVDAGTQRAEFYLQVLSVADTDHAHRADPYRLLIERRSTAAETIPAEPMSMASPVTLVGTTARIAAHRADLAYAMAAESPDELLVAGLSGDALGGTLVRLKGITSLELLDQTVQLLSTGAGLDDSPPSTGLSDSSVTTGAGPSDSSTSTIPAQILSPLAWRNHGPSGLGDGNLSMVDLQPQLRHQGALHITHDRLGGGVPSHQDMDGIDASRRGRRDPHGHDILQRGDELLRPLQRKHTPRDGRPRCIGLRLLRHHTCSTCTRGWGDWGQRKLPFLSSPTEAEAAGYSPRTTLLTRRNQGSGTP